MGRRPYRVIRQIVRPIPSPAIHRQANGFDIGAEKQCALHGYGDGATDETVEPVVVGLFRSSFPFVDSPTAALGFDEVLGGYLLGEHAVLFGAITTDEEAVQQKSQR
jgi:hypothetical protein